MSHINFLTLSLMKRKNNIIKKETGLYLLHQRDLQDVLDMTEEQHLLFWSQLHDAYTDKVIVDALLCPMCLLHRTTTVECGKCPYMLRHKNCENDKSLYRRVIRLLWLKGVKGGRDGGAIIKIPGMVNLVEKHIEHYLEIIKPKSEEPVEAEAC